MLVGTFDVETTAIGSCHQPSNRDVDDNAYSGDAHTQPSANGRGSDEASNSLDSDEDGDHAQRDAIDRSRHDLGSFPTPRPRSLRTAPSESRSPQGNGDGTGFVKIVADARHGELLGASLVGQDLSELLPELTLAPLWDITAEEIGRNIHAHPSLSEALKDAAEGVEGHMINF